MPFQDPFYKPSIWTWLALYIIYTEPFYGWELTPRVFWCAQLHAGILDSGTRFRLDMPPRPNVAWKKSAWVNWRSTVKTTRSSVFFIPHSCLLKGCRVRDISKALMKLGCFTEWMILDCHGMKWSEFVISYQKLCGLNVPLEVMHTPFCVSAWLRLQLDTRTTWQHSSKISKRDCWTLSLQQIAPVYIQAIIKCVWTNRSGPLCVTLPVVIRTSNRNQEIGNGH